MEIERIVLTIIRLINHWRNQNIEISNKKLEEIKLIENARSLKLPSDFKELYSRVNGMVNLYPNEMDEEGFLFYPVESILSLSKEFKDSRLHNKDKIFIFAEYMHKSWWYGFELTEENEYIIGIIPYSSSFKPITNSLVDFLEMYMEDSPKLYDYS